MNIDLFHVEHSAVLLFGRFRCPVLPFFRVRINAAFWECPCHVPRGTLRRLSVLAFGSPHSER